MASFRRPREYVVVHVIRQELPDRPDPGDGTLVAEGVFNNDAFHGDLFKAFAASQYDYILADAGTAKRDVSGDIGSRFAK
jgi:hypothetical protein